jgi:hypothetical protein
MDIVGLQETIKQDFSVPEIQSLECGGQFAWSWSQPRDIPEGCC